MPVDGEVCLPLPVLESNSLVLWRSPTKLVGGEALREALDEVEANRKKYEKKGGQGDESRAETAGGSSADGDAEVDQPQEVSVQLPPTTFDRKAKVVERHSERYRLC